MKSPISEGDRYRNPDEYKVMNGVYLEMKDKNQGKQLPRRVFYRME